MGCTTSKLDDLPAVYLCRQRCASVDEAIHQRYALSAAHISYINSLQSIALSFHHFIQFHIPTSASSPSKKPEPLDASPSPPRLSHSNAGSHLHFHSDSDEDDPHHQVPSLHHSGHSSPFHGHPDINHSDDQGLASFPAGDGYMHMNYMKNKATTSVVYELRPMSSNTVYMGESSSSSSSSSLYSYPQPNMNPNAFPHNGYQTYGGWGSGYYGYPTRYGPEPPVASSSSKPPPPPPSPPKSSAWDFLNFFDNDNKYYSQYTPSRDSKEVRDEEGIPDLENEDYRHEVVKQVHDDQSVADDGAGNHSKSAEENQANSAETVLSRTRSSDSAENDEVEVEYKVHVVDKKVVENDEKSTERCGPRNAFEVAREIEVQFRRASESGTEIAEMLEVGTLPYNRKHGAFQASSKMLHVIAPSLSMVSHPSASKYVESTSTVNKDGPSNLDFDEDLLTRSRNLSSTLQKLHLWEKKLYSEIKAEEKIRIIHDRKCHKLKHLEDRGADFHKVDSARTIIKSLSTKIRMAIQVVDKVSMIVNKIRDEELWPQLNELIQGLTRMWKSMLGCHRSQCEAIRESRILGSIGSREKSGDAHRATKQLEQELINWTFQFSGWVSAQKGYVRALNDWLLKCLLYEPEETSDGIVPFSPSRIGAPPIFVICNQWSQAMERISEKEVVDSMHVFTMSVLQIWEQDRLEMNQHMTVNKDIERNIDKDDHKLQKQIQALERKMVLASGEVKSLSISENNVHQGDKNSLQACLQRIFEAMERFTDSSVKIYEELLQRIDEESAIWEHERVS